MVVLRVLLPDLGQQRAGWGQVQLVECARVPSVAVAHLPAAARACPGVICTPSNKVRPLAALLADLGREERARAATVAATPYEENCGSVGMVVVLTLRCLRVGGDCALSGGGGADGGAWHDLAAGPVAAHAPEIRWRRGRGGAAAAAGWAALQLPGAAGEYCCGFEALAGAGACSRRERLTCCGGLPVCMQLCGLVGAGAVLAAALLWLGVPAVGQDVAVVGEVDAAGHVVGEIGSVDDASTVLRLAKMNGIRLVIVPSASASGREVAALARRQAKTYAAVKVVTVSSIAEALDCLLTRDGPTRG